LATGLLVSLLIFLAARVAFPVSPQLGSERFGELCGRVIWFLVFVAFVAGWIRQSNRKERKWPPAPAQPTPETLQPIDYTKLSAPVPVTAAPPSEGNADRFGEKAGPHPPVPVDVLVETLGVALAVFGGGILLHWLGSESKSAITTHGLVARSLTDLGWILLVICLLNRSGCFQWQIPGSKKAWLTEFGWGAALLAANFFAKAIVFGIWWKLHIATDTSPTMWSEALRHRNTWIAFQVIAPLSATYEELISRVYMQSRLTQILRGHSILVVLICSCLFAAVHGYSPLGSINVFVVGLILGASYQLNGKIPRLVIAHAASNMIGGFFANPG
jgi:membrane protease YdiL (CAAX protease family)